jgi:hypothetical protein
MLIRKAYAVVVAQMMMLWIVCASDDIGRGH